VQLRGLERWISLVRLVALPVVLVLVASSTYPPGWAKWAWIVTAVFAAGSVAFFRLARSELGAAHPFAQSLAAQIFDTAVVVGYVFAFSFARGLPVQQILYIDLAAACVRFGIPGGLVLAAISAPILAVFEHLRSQHLGTEFSWKLVALQTGLEVLMAVIVGWLVERLAAELAKAEARAAEAERLAEAERRTVDELRRLSRLRADFVSLVSHEVRTPMAAVIGSARTLQQRWPELSSDQRDAFLALIGDETDRLAALVGEVLDSSRIEAGTFSYRFAEVDLAGLVMDTFASAEIRHETACISVLVDPDLPPVRGDPARLRQVLTNLVENAIKYSPEGAPVEVRATARDGHATVAISDRGAGIEPRDQQLIFERFGRVRGTASKPGTGLGLYIARAIVEAHDGTLSVSSNLGEGSTFVLSLPVLDSLAASEPPIAAEA
jgi:signal transduction histidine kinase